MDNQFHQDPQEVKTNLDFETEMPKEPLSPKKRKCLLVLWGILTIALIGFIAYQFGYKKMQNDIYQKGVADGRQAQINELIVQAVNTGYLQFGVKTAAGEEQYLNLQVIK